jgi:cathepsin D
VKHQTIGAASYFVSDFFPPDGQMGLAFPSVSVYGAPSPIQNLISDGVLTCPMFGIKLAPNGSELFLGGVNTDLFQGEITWVPLSNAVCQISEYV